MPLTSWFFDRIFHCSSNLESAHFYCELKIQIRHRLVGAQIFQSPCLLARIVTQYVWEFGVTFSFFRIFIIWSGAEPNILLPLKPNIIENIRFMFMLWVILVLPLLKFKANERWSEEHFSRNSSLLVDKYSSSSNPRAIPNKGINLLSLFIFWAIW